MSKYPRLEKREISNRGDRAVRSRVVKKRAQKLVDNEAPFLLAAGSSLDRCIDHVLDKAGKMSNSLHKEVHKRLCVTGEEKEFLCHADVLSQRRRERGVRGNADGNLWDRHPACHERMVSKRNCVAE